MRLILLAVLGLALGLGLGCGFPEPSAEYACRTTADCDGGRICMGGYCVVSPSTSGDAALTPDTTPPPPDSDPQAELAAACLAKGYVLEAGPNGYYRTGANQKDWPAAQAECAADVPGKSHLIVLSTPTEVTYERTKPGWIGLSDRTTEGVFATVTGEVGDQRPFALGQPDNGGGSEDCVQMKSIGFLDDDQCDNVHSYVCECDGRASTP
jgi:hypothetical protein